VNQTSLELIGHQEPLDALRRLAKSDSLAHALLVTGADGIGKTTFALKLATDILCLEPGQDGAACGKCRACELTAVGNHPDMLRVTPEKEETTIGQMRDMRYVAALSPNLSRKRVVILERTETLNDQAANAILKVLEDAPETLVLILLAPSPESVISTIRSRSLHSPLRPVPLDILAKSLEEKGIEADQALSLARFSGGAPGRAIMLAGNPDLAACALRVAQWVDEALSAAPESALKLAEDLRIIAADVKAHLQDEEGGTDRQALAWTLDAVCAVLQSRIHGSSGGKRHTPETLAAMVEQVNETRRLILQYASAELMTERMVIRFFAL